ncbi:helix-turn-helix transcriptional regulator [Brucella intermedia]|uniref:helix-turn-helix domain-containing protein n=2 Tax=Brucella intermedia TaxID=94625 RepID=UPI0031F32E9C
MNKHQNRTSQQKSLTSSKNIRNAFTMLTPEQSRGARGLLDWSQTQLAEAANVSLSTVRDFEKGRRVPIANNLQAIRTALEAGGVIFIDQNGNGPGVRLRDRQP